MGQCWLYLFFTSSGECCNPGGGCLVSVPFSLSMEESIALPFTLCLSYSWIISRIVDEKTEFNTFIVFFCVYIWKMFLVFLFLISTK